MNFVILSTRRFFLLVLVLGGLTGLIAGCDSGPTLGPVTGRVTVNGKPLTAGWVNFKPDKAKGNKFGGEAIGEINAQGEYTLETLGKKGAPLGKYKVTVSATTATTPDNTTAKPKSLINTTYMHPDTTPLEVEVVTQPAAGAYDLKLTP